MENELKVLYTKLAEKMSDMIPGGWHQIYYLGEVTKNKESWSSIFYFTSDKSEDPIRSHSILEIYQVSEKIYNEYYDELNDILIAIYDVFVENDQKAWDQIRFEISENGNFNVEFSYEITNNDTDQILREVVWAYETFQYIPPKDTYTYEVLEEYLENKE